MIVKLCDRDLDLENASTNNYFPWRSYKVNLNLITFQSGVTSPDETEHRRSQDFLWGALFDDLFSSRPLKTQA